MTTTEIWTIGRLLSWTTDYLKKAGSQSPRLDAEVLLAHARGCQRIELYTAFGEEPSEQARAAFRELVRSRAAGTPVAYLVGYKEFYSMTFEVSPEVLIPRPETEHLVVEALDHAKRMLQALHSYRTEELAAEPSAGETIAEASSAVGVTTEDSTTEPSSPTSEDPANTHLCTDQLSMADIGTGSGAIAIAILKHLPQCRFTAVDISSAALEVARRNALRHGIDADRIQFVQGDLLSWCAPEQQFDLIVSNPPYVSPDEFEQLPKTVREFEPRDALISEPEGGSIIAKLISEACDRVRPGGYLIFEFSPMLEGKLGELIGPTGAWSHPAITKDISGHARVVTLQRLESPFQ